VIQEQKSKTPKAQKKYIFFLKKEEEEEG